MFSSDKGFLMSLRLPLRRQQPEQAQQRPQPPRRLRQPRLLHLQPLLEMPQARDFGNFIFAKGRYYVQRIILSICKDYERRKQMSSLHAIL
jgi:hypothetical protein